MSDDIVTRLWKAGRLARNGQMDRDGIGNLLDWCADAIDTRDAQIERLRAKVDDLLAYAEQDACAIERLRGEIERWRKMADDLAFEGAFVAREGSAFENYQKAVARGK